MPDRNAAQIVAALAPQRSAFKGFLARRLGNETDAEDLLQNGLLKALQHAGELNDDEKAVAWFYQILRHAIVDHTRSRHAAGRRDEAWASDAATLAAPDPAAQRHLCECFEGLLPTLKPAHAEMIRRVELLEQPVATAATALGISANNASVTLHRARNELRTRLVELCGPCADDPTSRQECATWHGHSCP